MTAYSSLEGPGRSPAIFLQQETQPCWAPSRCPAARLWPVSGKPYWDDVHGPSCHQHLWTSHQGQLFLLASWKDTGWRRLQRLSISLLQVAGSSLASFITLQGCGWWYKVESCMLLTPALRTTEKGSKKRTFVLWCSQIAPLVCCKCAGGEYYSPTKSILESGVSLWLVLSVVWGKGVSF